MKKTENIDELIHQALNKEEAEFYNQLNEQNLPEMVTGLYRGKLGWLTILMSIVMVFIFAGGVYCVIQFFNSSNATEMIMWGAGVFLSLMIVSFLKLINFIQMYSNKISREIKRLEFQIAILSNKVT